ncbi:MAG: glutathione S-transferase family protein [Alphaproteobacteria bacterium]|nr:glutathione S-transferase family protein [Alphaproteobacteria bacterium]
MPILYDDPISGNGYKVRLLLAQLDFSYELVELDILNQETHTPDFLAKNANGKIPTIELDDGRCLSESNAILFYFAQGSRYWPGEKFDQADVMRWMCFEQYSHEPYVAVARFLHHLPEAPDPEVIAEKHAKGYVALDVMEQHLGENDFFAAGQYSIADIALYAYTHVAEEGKFDLTSYSNISKWLDRVSEQPGFVPMGSKPN